MKLATYKDGSRDGQLVVVSRDLSSAHYATGIANKLQQVLDDWNFLSPQLQDLYDALNRTQDTTSSAGQARHAFPFDPAQCMAPLPRAYQRVVEWVGHDQPGSLRQCLSGDFLGACEDVLCVSHDMAIDFQSGLAAITGDVARGTTPTQALEGIRLLMLTNDVTLRNLRITGQSADMEQVQSQLASACSPVAVTLDECGSAWVKGRLNLSLQSNLNGRKFGLCDCGAEMPLHFGQLLAQLGKYRKVPAGSIIGASPAGNKNKPHGYNSIAGKRAAETLQDGQPVSEFLKYGDTLRIEMPGLDGQSLFGAIEQQIAVPTSRGAVSF